MGTLLEGSDLKQITQTLYSQILVRKRIMATKTLLCNKKKVNRTTASGAEMMLRNT